METILNSAKILVAVYQRKNSICLPHKHCTLEIPWQNRFYPHVSPRARHVDATPTSTERHNKYIHMRFVYKIRKLPVVRVHGTCTFSCMLPHTQHSSHVCGCFCSHHVRAPRGREPSTAKVATQFRPGNFHMNARCGLKLFTNTAITPGPDMWGGSM